MQNKSCAVSSDFAGLRVKLESGLTRFTDRSDDNRDQPFIVHYIATGLDGKNTKALTVGDLFINYDITFYGLRPA